MPSHGSSLLNIVLESQQFNNCIVECCGPLAGFDHNTQRLNFSFALQCEDDGKRSKIVDIEKLIRVLASFD